MNLRLNILIKVITVSLIIVPLSGWTQTNFVINGDFENYSSCPINEQSNDIRIVTGWDYPYDTASWHDHNGEVAYFNQKCNVGYSNNHWYWWRTLPNNRWGIESPRSGTGYAGVSMVYTEPPIAYFSSFLQGSLKPLTKNRVYFFEMYLSLTEYSQIACGHIGALFSDTPISAYHSATALYGLKPDIIDTLRVTQMNGWYRISGKYKAKGLEKYVLIGAFSADTLRFDNSSGWGNYFIDDVFLRDCDSTDRHNILPTDTLVCNLSPFKLNAHQNDTMVSYLWSTGSTKDTMYATQSGIYWVDVSINGCPPSRDTIVLDMENQPIANLGPDTILCITKGLSLHTRPSINDTSYHFKWNTGDTTANLFIDTTGTYNVLIDHHGCKAADTVHIYRFPLKQFDLGKDSVMCTDANYTLDATTLGAEGYRWSTGDTTAIIHVNKSGTYWGEAFNGICSFRDSVRLTLYPFPKVDLGPPFMDVCDNLNVKLDAGNPGATYQWNVGDTSRLYKVVNSGYYKVDVTQNGCKSADSIDVSVLPAPKFELGPDTTLCEGTPKLLDATNTGSTYLWQDNTTKATYLVTSQGLYKVKVTKGKCVVSDSVEITYTPKPVFSLGNDTSSCFEVPKYFDVSSAIADSYLWQDNTTAPTYTATSAGLIWVQVNKDACILRDSVVLTQLPQALPDLGPDSFFCAGEYFTLNPGANFSSYLWIDNSSNPQLKVNQPGSYWVVVKNNSGCKGKDSIALSVQQLPVVSLGKDTALCEPDLLLNAGSGFNSYLWQDGSTGAQLHVTDYGTYKIKVSGTKGCTNEAQITVTNNCPTDLYVPNAFTPNNDGVNDVFMPVALNVKTVHLEIYNRWGQLVYATDDITKGWNGKYEGEFAPIGVYVYVAKYADIHGQENVKTGNVTLLK